MKEIKVRNVKINFDKSMSKFNRRRRHRRKVIFYFIGEGKDKIWHRAVKRSIKHYDKMTLIKEIAESKDKEP